MISRKYASSFWNNSQLGDMASSSPKISIIHFKPVEKDAEHFFYSGYCENPHPTDSEKWMNYFTNLYSRFHPAVLVRHRCLHEAYKSWHKSVILLREWPAELALATRWVQRANTQAIAQQCTTNTAWSKLVTRSIMAVHTERAHSDIWAKWILNMNKNEINLISELHKKGS